MIINDLKAFVLQTSWSGDTSARVTFFTREQGMVRALCQGGRTPKKQPLLQPFIPLWLSMDVRGEWWTVRQIERAEASYSLIHPQLFAGLYVNELLYRMQYSGSESTPLLYDAYIGVLEALVMASDRVLIEQALRRFEQCLLTISGYQLLLSTDAHSGLPIEEGQQYLFIADEGFILAPKGIPGAHILAIAADNLDALDVLRSAKGILRHAINHALGGQSIRARELYR